MLQISIDEDMPGHVFITHTGDSQISKRLRLGTNEVNIVKSWFKQANEMIGVDKNGNPQR